MPPTPSVAQALASFCCVSCVSKQVSKYLLDGQRHRKDGPVDVSDLRWALGQLNQTQTNMEHLSRQVSLYCEIASAGTQPGELLYGLRVMLCAMCLEGYDVKGWHLVVTQIHWFRRRVCHTMQRRGVMWWRGGYNVVGWRMM